MSEMSASRVENASEIVDVGEQVWIKVIGREVTTHTDTHTNTQRVSVMLRLQFCPLPLRFRETR